MHLRTAFRIHICIPGSSLSYRICQNQIRGLNGWSGISYYYGPERYADLQDFRCKGHETNFRLPERAPHIFPLASLPYNVLVARDCTTNSNSITEKNFPFVTIKCQSRTGVFKYTGIKRPPCLTYKSCCWSLRYSVCLSIRNYQETGFRSIVLRLLVFRTPLVRTHFPSGKGPTNRQSFE